MAGEPVWTERRVPMSERSASGALLVLGAVLASIGAALFGFGGVAGTNSPLFVPTRSFILAAVVTNALGLALLESLLRDAGERVLSRVALIAFLIAAVLAVVQEALLLDGREYVDPLDRVHVVLAFLSQSAFGGALLRTRLLPTWVGRMTVAWNLGWFALLLVVSVGNRPDYYPVLHYFAPLLIGIELIRHRRSSTLTVPGDRP
jgi:hypothetical protein